MKKADVEKCSAQFLERSLARDKENKEKEAELQKLQKMPEPKIGMTTFEAKSSRWGPPEFIRRTQMVGAELEHWTYFQSNRELHFKNGELVLIRR